MISSVDSSNTSLSFLDYKVEVDLSSITFLRTPFFGRVQTVTNGPNGIDISNALVINAVKESQANADPESIQIILTQDGMYTRFGEGTNLTEWTGMKTSPDQYRRVSSLSDQEGSPNIWYYLDTPEGSYSVGSYIWDEVSGFIQVSSGGSSSGGLFLGIVTKTSTLPTTRPDSTPLQTGDYVKPDSNETFPFTISGITFTTARDTAVFMSGSTWVVNTTPYQKTSETPVINQAQESILGTSQFQNEINKELKDTLTFKHTQSVASTSWNIIHNLNRYPSVCCTDNTGNQIFGAVSYPNPNNIIIEFSTAETGLALLS